MGWVLVGYLERPDRRDEIKQDRCFGSGVAVNPVGAREAAMPAAQPQHLSREAAALFQHLLA